MTILLKICLELTSHITVVNFFVLNLLLDLLMIASTSPITATVLSIFPATIVVLSTSSLLRISLWVFSLDFVLLFCCCLTSEAFIFAMTTISSATIVLVVVVAATITSLLLFEMLIFDFFLDLTLGFRTLVEVLCFEPARFFVTEHVFDEQSHSVWGFFIILIIDQLIKLLKYFVPILWFILILFFVLVNSVLDILFECLSNLVHEVDSSFDSEIVGFVICFIHSQKCLEDCHKGCFW